MRVMAKMPQYSRRRVIVTDVFVLHDVREAVVSVFISVGAVRGNLRREGGSLWHILDRMNS